MQFITTDQRIAVENFEVGVVYTVAFTSGDSFTGSCMGIGVDFVAFQRTAPEYIFCLTMTTAADVASIDPLGDDIGKIIEYTGTVPTTIKTDGSPLLDYLITGNTIQNGTPTPENPIMPEGCGELEAGQYKIPILSAGQTTPVYLGEVQITRKIKKLVFDGTENWVETAGIYFDLYVGNIIAWSECICTHCKFNDIIGNNTGVRLWVKKAAFTEYSTVTDFKAFLAAQYAAGTPVCVWYVLATEETAVVNEPLMKIGGYADTLSYRQSGVSIPTTDGLNIFDIDTTVKPSEVYLKYFSPLF